MKLRKVIVSLLLVMSLTMLAAIPTFALTVKENDTYTWEKVDDEWTCEDYLGKPVRGWAKHGEDIYYMNKDGVMKTGWVKYLGSWYYLYKDSDLVEEDLVGTLATDTWIDNYYVNKSGVMTKTR